MSPLRRRAEAEPERILPAPQIAGRVLDAQLHLLDRQILDAGGVPVTTVDDVEIAGLDPDGGGSAPAQAGPAATGPPAPRVGALLTGPVLGTRIFGGRPPADRFVRIPWRDVAEVGTVIRLGVRGDSLEASWVERWLRNHVIARIPGGRHAPD
ncbi:hypothetical protein [Sinomonas halotolerans]|uniref:Uncharacterized protein n=1 Tax=Sinomonas halotolerans TaxID=1644133 RepID=A0ABU9WZ66_9MICC